MNLAEFSGVYFSEGLACLFHLDQSKPNCHFSFFYLLGYTFSLFVLQCSLTFLMEAKKTQYARKVFSFMIPLTLFAFVLASFADPSIQLGAPDWLDIAAVVVAGSGVWLYNWNEEKPQKASLEDL